MTDKNIIVFHHGSSCPDGFGAAYAAWKKFGDSADYIPLAHGDEPPVEMARGKEVYFVDFTYSKEVMDKFVAVAAKLTSLDHHEGVQEVTESMPEHVFDGNRSGAGITWDYLHPNVPRPTLINHVEDDDLFRFSLPDTRAIITYLEVQPFDFTVWDDFAKKLDHPEEKEAILAKARAYRDYFEALAKISVDHAKLVRFEGYEIYFAQTHPLKSLKSFVGNELAKKTDICAIVVSVHPKGYGVSIRGTGKVDVAKIAQKFGGNGHPVSAGFAIPREGPFPWELIEENENPRPS